MADVFGDAVEEHLHGEQNQQCAHEAGEGEGAFFAHEVEQLVGDAEEDGRADPGQEDGEEAFRLLQGCGGQGRLHHDHGDGSGPHDDGHGDGDEQGLGHGEVLVRAPLGGEYHAHRDDEEHDATAQIQRGAADAHPPQKRLAQEIEEEQQHQHKAQLAYQHGPPPVRRKLLHEALEHRRIPRCIHDQKQGTRCRYDMIPIHTIYISFLLASNIQLLGSYVNPSLRLDKWAVIFAYKTETFINKI